MTLTYHKIHGKALVYKVIVGFVLLWSFGSVSQKKSPAFHKDFTVYQLTQSFANIYIIEQDKKLLMIDSGNPGKGDELESKLMDIGVDPTDIDYLILTHAHPDHAGNAFYFKEKYGVKIVIGAEEKEILSARGRDKNLCPRGPLGLLVRYTHANKTYKEFVPDILINERFDLSVIGFKGFIHPNPGHTPGSLYIEIQDAVFVGDLIRGQSLNQKKPAYHLFMCDLEENLQHIKEIEDKTHLKWWYPGHGGPIKQEDVTKFIQKEKEK